VITGVERSRAGSSYFVTPDSHDGYVRVRGAREHNLQGVDVEMPRDSLVAFTGVSGSGKSSLAFGTIYAEAQRRYFESVAPYARRLIHQMGVPKVDDSQDSRLRWRCSSDAEQRARGRPSAPSPPFRTTCGCCSRERVRTRPARPR
jgi:hypothetical protein